MVLADDPDGLLVSGHLQTLPGDGLIALGSHHLVVVELDDDAACSGFADDILSAHEAHSRLVGRGAAVSLRLAVSAILAEHGAASSAVAIVSAWEDVLAVYLHGDATATFRSDDQPMVLSGHDALVATDVVLSGRVEGLELRVGEQPPADLLPLHVGEVASGRAVRLTWPSDERDNGQLNDWDPPA
jgi:hypothetical protein